MYEVNGHAWGILNLGNNELKPRAFRTKPEAFAYLKKMAPAYVDGIEAQLRFMKRLGYRVVRVGLIVVLGRDYVRPKK